MTWDLWRPPNGVLIDQEIYPISTDFSTGISYTRLISCGKLTESAFFALWFPEKRPKNVEKALEAVGAFYRMGRPPAEEDSGPVPYDLLLDAGPIYAQFYRCYGLDLARTRLHWWRFLSLLEGLITHSFSQRVAYRTASLEGLDAAGRGEILRCRQVYEIPRPGEGSLQEHLRRLTELGGNFPTSQREGGPPGAHLSD